MPQWIAPTIPPGVSPWAYYVLVGTAVLITGLSKSGFGGGTGILANPLLAPVMGPEHMLGVMLPLLIACDVLSNLHYVGEQDWGRLRPLLVGATFGVILGTGILLALHELPPGVLVRAMNGIIGGICLAVVLMQAYRLTGRRVPMLPPGAASGAAVGFVAGTISTINHSAGPLATIYFLQEKVAERILVGSLLVYFLIINSVKLLPYTLVLHTKEGGAFINASTLHDSIWFIPLIPLGTLAGAWMNKRVPERPFAAVMYVAAGIAAAWMLVKAIR